MRLSDAKRAPRRRPIAAHPSETKSKAGRPANKAVAKLMSDAKCSRATAFRVLKRRADYKRTLWERHDAEPFAFSSIIKPTDNWNFHRVYYDRLDVDPSEGASESYGYLPGDLYANALFYFARPGDLVVVPMAGSGQIQRVYEDRAAWTKGLVEPLDLDLRLFDLTPRGPYKSLIRPWDLLEGFPPVERAPDLTIMDLPYLGMCRGQYSDKAEDIANMDEAGWTRSMGRIAEVCASAGTKRACIIVATLVDSDRRTTVLCPEIVRDAWRAVGYRLAHVCYASRRIQASRRARMPVLNNRAKRDRLPQCDVSEVLTFVQ